MRVSRKEMIASLQDWCDNNNLFLVDCKSLVSIHNGFNHVYLDCATKLYKKLIRKEDEKN